MVHSGCAVGMLHESAASYDEIVPWTAGQAKGFVKVARKEGEDSKGRSEGKGEARGGTAKFSPRCMLEGRY